MIWGETTKEMLNRVFGKHKWFAYRPVKLKDGRWVWWQLIYKQEMAGRGGNWVDYTIK